MYLSINACSQADDDVAQADEDVETLRVTANTLLDLFKIPSRDLTSYCSRPVKTWSLSMTIEDHDVNNPCAAVFENFKKAVQDYFNQEGQFKILDLSLKQNGITDLKKRSQWCKQD